MNRLCLALSHFVLLTFLSSVASLAAAEWKNPLSSPEGMFDYRKKAEKKKSSRWTLQEWLELKERNRMMDLWLGMYAPSPYEFYLEGIYASGEGSIANSKPASVWHYTGRLGISVLILGIEVSHKNDWISNHQENSSQLRLRILGNAVQGTHLIIGAGQSKSSNSGITLQQNFATADFDLYIEQHSGLHFAYKNMLPAQSNGLSYKGSKVEGGLFFDVSFLQVFIRYFDEKIQNSDSAGVQLSETRERGTEAGLKFFF